MELHFFIFAKINFHWKLDHFTKILYYKNLELYCNLPYRDYYGTHQLQLKRDTRV